jgi:small subunit ribosomal protein S20
VANHKDAAKRAGQAIKRRARNRSNRTRMRNEIADLRGAIAAKKGKEDIQSALSEAVSVIQKLAAKGIIHKNQADRRVKRLHHAAKKAA